MCFRYRTDMEEKCHHIVLENAFCFSTLFHFGHKGAGLGYIVTGTTEYFYKIQKNSDSE
jgi:hypothetical protein